jgi:amidase
VAEPRVPLRRPYRDPGWVPSELEDPLNAVIRFCEVRGAADGPLAGMRVGVKDCVAVAAVPMTVGGRRTPVAVPAEDAVVVERLLDAGATIVAKTNMADMALGLGGGVGVRRHSQPAQRAPSGRAGSGSVGRPC